MLWFWLMLIGAFACFLFVGFYGWFNYLVVGGLLQVVVFVWFWLVVDLSCFGVGMLFVCLALISSLFEVGDFVYWFVFCCLCLFNGIWCLHLLIVDVWFAFYVIWFTISCLCVLTLVCCFIVSLIVLFVCWQCILRFSVDCFIVCWCLFTAWSPFCGTTCGLVGLVSRCCWLRFDLFVCGLGFAWFCGWWLLLFCHCLLCLLVGFDLDLFWVWLI